MKVKFIPPKCFGSICPYDEEYSYCEKCEFISECSKEFEKTEEEYRYWNQYWNHIP